MTELFGREEIFSTLKKRLTGFTSGYRQNIAIIGNPLMGKTSILRAFLPEIKESGIVPVYVDLSNGITPKQIAETFFLQILNPFLTQQNIDLVPDTADLIAKSQAFLPKTTLKINSINQSLNKNKESAALLEVFELINVFCQESNKQCLIILDEFHCLEEVSNKDVFSELGKKIIVQKNIMYLISSSSVIKAKEILASGLSLLFGNFEVLDLSAYSIAASDKFITKNITASINNKLRRFLIDFTCGNPFYLDIFTKELSLLAKIENTQAINEEILVRSFKNLLWDDWGIVNQRFSCLLRELGSDKLGHEYISILSCVAWGQNIIKQIALQTGKKENAIYQRMLRLYDTGIIAKNGDFVCLTDKIFGFWFKHAYSIKKQPCYVYEENPAAHFTDSIISVIRDFFTQLEKPLIERIMGLFNLFKNESVNIERKKLTLSSLKDMKLVKMNTGSFEAMVCAKSINEPWVVAVKRGVLYEDDISEFISECKKYGQLRAQKKIIITLNDIEPNAKLKALQEKIITWQTREINFLLDLYNKPAIFV